VEVSTDKGETLERLEAAHRERVEALGFSWSQLRRAELVHGDGVAVVTGEEAVVVPGVDGLITEVPGIVLGIYVADCAAVYLVDRVTGAIGLVHSGKKGTELGIVGVAVGKMGEAFGTRSEDLEVAISPCIRPPHYEVDFAAEIGRQLRELGVPAEQITDRGICTGAGVGEWYSYRIEEGCTGRMLALLGRPEHEEVGA
jgi:copper oxidase (laccase) domain-containing protein